MIRRLQIASVLATLAVAATSPWTLRASALDSQVQGPGIPSLTEPGESLAILQTSETGAAAFAATRGQGILLPVGPTDPAAARALVFIDLYGHAFGLPGRGNVRLSRPSQRDLLGIEHVKFQQVHQGVPVAGGEFIVHLKGARVVSANGRLLPRLPADMSPAVVPEAALQVSRQVIGRYKAAFASSAQYSAPRLEIVNRSFLEHRTGSLARLAWFIEATAPGMRQFIWIDARNADLVLQFSQSHTVRNRLVYNSSGTANLPGTLARWEGGLPMGSGDVDDAYDLSGATYDYFFDTFGRDSYDGFGAQIVSSVNYFDGFTCPNAFWSSTGSQLVYCPGFASADDVVGHELTHAVIQYEANLYYYTQSGALNESFADIFGETIDLVQVPTGDAPGDRWLLAENSPIGVIRSMADPNIYGDPGKVSDFGLFQCDLQADGGGVHANSGVPNHAYALMVDGGNYNGYAINGIGLDKAARVQYRALTTYLTTSSGFLDNFTALNHSCSDLIGTNGITHADCAEIEKALRAVEMNSVTGCQDPNLLVQPAMCPAGGTPAFAFQEGFEAGMPGWVPSNPMLWGPQTVLVHEGAYSVVGLTPGSESDHHLASPAPGVLVPPGGRMIFDHSFGFETGGGILFDGGVLEYSNNNGASWLDAASLMDGGYLYNGLVDNGNPLYPRMAFTMSTPGFVRTRLTLASLAGQTVRFRWRIGTDFFGGDQGWFLDNIRIYSCPGAAGAPTINTQPLMLSVAAGQPATFMVGATGNPPLRYQWLWNGVPIPGATASILNIASVQHGHFGYYSVIVSNDVGTATSDGAVLLVQPAMAPMFTNQPASRTISAGQSAQFMAGVTSLWAVTYQWEFSTNGGASWSPVPNAPPYAGGTTTTLTIAGATVGLNGTLYRLAATSTPPPPDLPSTVTSNVVTLNVLAANLIANGDFSSGSTAGWAYFDSPAGSGESRVVNGVFEWNRPGGSSTQSVIFQTTGAAVSGTPLEAQFDLGNSSDVRKRVSVLMLDADFTDLSVCTFWLEPDAPLRTYRMRTHTTKPWTNAAIYFYAATTGNAATTGGYLQLDDVSMSYNPTGSDLRVDCVDPTSPAPAPGAPPSASVITNGDFSAGMASWGTFGTITGGVTNGVFEFIRTAGSPGGVVLQPTGAAVAAGEFLTATFDLGNSSAVRKRVTLLIHANDFSDLAACTFWLPPGQPLMTYQMKMRATKPWAAGAATGATFALYGASASLDQWIQLDNVSLQRTPGSAIAGTECIEAAGIVPASPAGARTPDGVVAPPAPPGAPQSPRETAQFARLNFDEPVMSEWASGVDSLGTRLLRWKRPVDVDATAGSKLLFVSSVEGGAGSAEVQVSLDGFTWRTVARIPPDEAWTEVQVDLSEFVGQRVYVQFAYTPLLGEKAVWRVTKVRVSRHD